MLQVFKILAGKDNVRIKSWLKMAASGVVRTIQAAGVMNILKLRTRLEVRAIFFSLRVVDSWNNVPDEIKLSRTPGQFKRQCKQTALERPTEA